MSDVRLSEAVDLLCSLQAGSVAMVFADPPYGVAYHSNHYVGRNPHDPVVNDWNFQIGLFLREGCRVLRDGGALYLCSRWDVSPLWWPSIQASGLKCKTKVIWVKDNWSAGDLKGCFGNQYEELLFLVKGRHLLRGHRWPNVWQFKRIVAKRLLCATQKPVDLIERAILSSSDSGDLVVDPYCGSGSTGAAAINTGRDYLLGDISQKMVRIARERLGLSVGDEQIKEQESLRYEVADPLGWGIHPEDLQYIKEEFERNRESNLVVHRPGLCLECNE